MRQFSFCLSALLVGAVVNAQDVLKPLVVESDRALQLKGNVPVEEIDAERVSELLGYLPGFSSVASDSAGYGDVIGVRGSTNTLFFGGAGVAMVVDDVPFGDVFGYSTEFFDLESFTLHRGPQGSRFARNGVGGLMELKTRGPGKKLEHAISAEYGSYNLTHLRFRSSGPLEKDWSYDFQAYSKARDGFVENTTLDRDTDTREQFGSLGSLYYHPSKDFEMRFRFMYERTRDGSQRLTALPGVTSAFEMGVGGPIGRVPGPFSVASDLAGRTEIDRFQFSMHLDQDFGWGKFKSITAYSNWKLGPNTVDLDLSPSLLGRSESSIEQEQNLFSQEFRLESDPDSDVRWAGGLAYLHKDNQGVANRIFPIFVVPGVLDSQFTTFDIEEESIALFGNLQWDPADRLTVEVGGRLEYVDNSIERSKTSFFALPGAFSGESDGFYFSPSVGATYALTPETSLFARTSLAYKPQGFTAFSDAAGTTEFDEEQTWETEIGVRYQSSDESLSAELRGYYKQIDDYQVNQSVPMTTDFIIANADRVEALGVEGEVFWKPVSGLTVQASAGWNQIEFDDHTGAAGGDLSGNDVPFIPEFTAGMAVRYDFDNGFYAQTGVRAVGATYYDESNNSDFRQGSYEVWDAQIGYQGEGWNAALFARNLFDEDYYSFMNNQIAAGVAGDPEMYGVRFGLEF